MPLTAADGLPVATGLVTGIAYATAARFIDRNLHLDAPAHVWIDWTLPVVLGLAFGVALAYALRRARIARERRDALVALERRLTGTEREQAVWVLASALLHDLRNPLHTVGLALEELARTSKGSGDDAMLVEARRGLDTIDGKFRELQRMVREPSSEAGDFDVSALVSDVAQHCESFAASRGVTLTAWIPPAMRALGDGAMARTSLENLLCNAIDAASEASAGRERRVEVQVESAGEGVSIRIEDSGPGVPAELAASIFQPLRSTKGGDGRGLGLGLPIARALVRAQGGDLSVEPGDHGRFVLRLHRAAVPA